MAELSQSEAAVLRRDVDRQVSAGFTLVASVGKQFYVEIDAERMVRSCRRAATNKTRRRRDGPITIRYTGRDR